MAVRIITFAGSSLAIEYSGAQFARIIQFLYCNVPADPNVPLRLTYRLQPGRKPSSMTLYRGDVLLYEGDSEAVLADLLLSDSCYQLADQSRGGLLFHAASLAWQDKGLILPGPIGAGKSTLAAWLATRGFDYLTDEMVFVPLASKTMQTFTRPLNLKRPSRAVLQNAFDFDGQSELIFRGCHSDLVSAAVLKPSNTLSDPVPKLITFPRYLPDSDFVLRPLSRAQASFQLMQCLVNARNLPEHGFREVVCLARNVPAYQMRYGNFNEIGGQVESLLESL